MTRCVICERDFETVEWHHVIPQSCGGKDGPVVSLCGVHHTAIHETAKKMVIDYRRNSATLEMARYQWGGDEARNWANAVHYIKEIVQATLRPNHDTSVHSVVLVVTFAERKLLRQLKARMGVSSQEKVIRKALAMAASYYDL